MSSIQGPRIGIALGGGSARGLAHIAFIEAMDELGLRPSLIAGTSIGALLGAGWAAGMRGSEIREHAYQTLGTMRAITGRLWTTRMRKLNTLFENGISLQLDARHVVESFLPPDFPDTFRDLRTPLYTIATDFYSWHQVVTHSGPLVPAIAGSIAVPSLFRPVTTDGRTLVDGSVTNPLPLDIASANVDILIGIDVNGDPEGKVRTKPPSAFDYVTGSAQIMMHQLIAHSIAAYPPDVYFRPHIKMFMSHEFWRVREIVEAADPNKERFKRDVTHAMEAFIGGQQKRM